MKLIAAADKNWGIGLKNRLLISIPADMRFFRETTTGHVVVMGRKTLESFPNGAPLKNRENIVLTRRENYNAKGAYAVHDIPSLLEYLKGYPQEEIYVIGGESVYRALLPYCDTAYITRIDYTYEADAFFPDLDADEAWEMTQEGEEETYFDLAYHFTVYRRIGG